MRTRQPERVAPTPPLGRRPPWWRDRRRNWIRGTVAVVGTLVVMSLVARQSRDAADLAAAFGTRRTVMVARHDLDPGDVITDDDVTAIAWPVTTLPAGAMDGEVVGRLVTAVIVRGESINRARLAPAGVSGLAALVPSDRRGVSVPRPSDGSGLAVEVGDVVDVLSPDLGASASEQGASVAAVGATVIGLDAGAVTLAVRDGDALTLAAALGRGIPVLAMVGPGSTP